MKFALLVLFLFALTEAKSGSKEKSKEAHHHHGPAEMRKKVLGWLGTGRNLLFLRYYNSYYGSSMSTNDSGTKGLSLI